MIYELINPSDCVTLECDDTAVAAVVCILLGNGQYALDCPSNPQKNIPLFMFGGFEEWWNAQKPAIGMTLNEFIDANTEKICVALESCMGMRISERENILKAKEHMSDEEWRKYIMKVNDDNRSSMNDICGRAFKIAEKLRAKQKDLPKAPVQVLRSA